MIDRKLDCDIRATPIQLLQMAIRIKLVFEELISILDTDLRLITPTEAGDSDAEEDRPRQAEAGGRYYH